MQQQWLVHEDSGMTTAMGMLICLVSMCRFRYDYSDGRVDLFGVYFTPLSPGVTRSFFKMVNLNAPSAVAKFSKLPRWFLHNFAGTQGDQDAVMLHGQVCVVSLCCTLLVSVPFLGPPPFLFPSLSAVLCIVSCAAAYWIKTCFD